MSRSAPPAVPTEAALVARAAAVARRLVPAWRERGFEAIEYLPGGYSNRNYRLVVDGAPYALRVMRQPPRPGERAYLASAAAPDVVAHDAARGHLVTHWIAGPLLTHAPASPAQAGAYLAALHRQVPVGVRAYDLAGEMRALFAAADLPDSAVVARWKRLQWTPARVVGCHNDLNPWNIVRGEGQWRTLDWEMAGDNDPLFDLAGLALGLGWDLDATAACHAAYQAASGHAAAEDARGARQPLRDAMTAYRIREYAWAVAQLARGNRRPEIHDQAQRMRTAVLSAG